MFNRITEIDKKNNSKYTAECKKIYEDTRFARIEHRSLYNGIIPLVFIIFSLIFLATDIFVIANIMLKNDKYDMFFNLTIFIISFLFLSLTVGIIIFYVKKYTPNKKTINNHIYILKQESFFFKIVAVEENGAENAKIIVNVSNKKTFYPFKNTVVSDGSLNENKLSGFYQYTVGPNKVFSNDVGASQRYRYKKKKIKGNKTIYYFPAFDTAVIGAKYPRGITLENGVVKDICVQTIHRMQGTSNTSSSSYIYKYSCVNDRNVKIHISKFVQEEAKRLKFTLPKESENIVYDNE